MTRDLSLGSTNSFFQIWKKMEGKIIISIKITNFSLYKVEKRGQKRLFQRNVRLIINYIISWGQTRRNKYLQTQKKKKNLNSNHIWCIKD